MKLVVKQAPVATPGMSARVNLQGVVTAEICIDPTGRVVAIKILKGHPMAQQAVLESLRKWQFAPYILNGRARSVVGTLDVPFDFRAP